MMKEFKMTRTIKTYLEEVWGYDRIEDIDPLTASCIIENCEDPDAVNPKTGEVIWISDFALKQAICKFRGIPYDVTYEGFKKYYSLKWFNKDNAKKKYNEAHWRVQI